MALSPDHTVPQSARIFDYLLGGKDNFAPDRQAVDDLRELRPRPADIAKSQRDFLRRAVMCVAGRGVRQFLDLGAGLPTGPTLGEIARAIQPDTRVVYVDAEPMVISHLRAVVRDDRSVICHGDIKDPARVLLPLSSQGHLDLTEPICLTFSNVLGWLGGDVVNVVRNWRRLVSPGSYVIVSNPDTSAAPYRTVLGEGMERDEIAHMITDPGWYLVAPGVVSVTTWRPSVHRTRATPFAASPHRPLHVPAWAGVSFLPV